MIELRDVEWYDPAYDTCGEATVAILKINNMIIPLCAHCLLGIHHKTGEYLIRPAKIKEDTTWKF